MQTSRARPVMPNAGAHSNTSESQYTEQIYEQPPRSKFCELHHSGFSQGFQVGFRYRESTLKQSKSNMAVDNPQVVSDYIAEELAADRLTELIPKVAKSIGIHCSPIGIILKKNKPGKWRLIVDLSSRKC